MQRLGPVALLCGITAVWGATFAIVKDAIGQYGVVPFLAVRFALAALVLACVSGRRLSRQSLKAGAAIGLALGLAYFLQTLGLLYTSATNSGLITGLFVVFAPLLNRLLFGVRIAGLYWLAVAGCVAGIALLTGAAPTLPTIGDLYTLGCAAAFGLQVALLDRWAKHHDAGALALAQVGAVAALFLLAWPASGPVVAPPATVWSALLVTAVIATAAGLYVQTFVQQRLPAVQVAVVIATEPLFAAIFGFLLAGDRLNGLQIAGAAVLVGSVVLAEAYPAMRRNHRATPEGGTDHVAA